MKLLNHFFESDQEVSLSEQLKICCYSIKKWLKSQQISTAQIVSLNVFIDAKNNREYTDQKKIITSVLHDYLSNSVSCVALAQLPINNKGMAIEILALPPIANTRIDLAEKVIDGNNYKTLIGENEEKILFVPGLQQSYVDENVISAAESLFHTMEKILQAEGMNFSHIVRQWNYIEGITQTKQTAAGGKQHYQIFNDTRAKFYKLNEFVNGYPAATGIGTDSGGISISFYAISGKSAIIIPVENPLQISAYTYSPKVLIGDGTKHRNDKESPKFARAKYLETFLGKEIFISGTASIRGEKTIGNTEQEQTKTTLQNIEQLISSENLRNAGIESDSHKAHIQYLRVYIKSSRNSERIMRICSETLPKVKFLFVCADICRDNLLLEIEGNARF